MTEYVIERDASGTVNGVEQTGRVYVQDLVDAIPSYPRRYAFSGVREIAGATKFPKDEAERLARTKWRRLRPEVRVAK